VAQRVPGGLGTQISMTFCTWRWWRCRPHAPAAITPRKCSWYSFSLGAESTPGPWYRQCTKLCEISGGGWSASGSGQLNTRVVPPRTMCELKMRFGHKKNYGCRNLNTDLPNFLVSSASFHAALTQCVCGNGSGVRILRFIQLKIWRK